MEFGGVAGGANASETLPSRAASFRPFHVALDHAELSVEA